MRPGDIVIFRDGSTASVVWARPDGWVVLDRKSDLGYLEQVPAARLEELPFYEGAYTYAPASYQEE